jgi:hypothetical protein
MFVTWFLTVPSARQTRSAISLFDAPRERRERISRSRGDSEITRASASGGPDSMRRAIALTTRPVTVLCRNDSPRAAAWMAATSVSSETSFSKYPDAPARSERRQRQDGDVRGRFAQLRGGVDAVHQGHAQIHQDDRRLKLFDEFEHLQPVGRLADDLDVGPRRQQRPQALAEQCLVVGQNNPDCVHP